ncbi:unnamed protein product [Lepeophtheirus salmonis]|uniref:(salmon louse) hypothetical protein n=1 Tax=Lepeophtheirus salmonis TaxID=72036 RepID=A0A7R8CIC9_LEPSM|nr:unnamed protein product [Lepeophtheirus salmonis]CAF2825942.1 unnamed protein product [Lepeophtheirus salmonis]
MHTVRCSVVVLPRLHEEDPETWFLRGDPKILWGISPQERTSRPIDLLSDESISSKKVFTTSNRLLDASFVPNLLRTLDKEILDRSIATSHRTIGRTDSLTNPTTHPPSSDLNHEEETEVSTVFNKKNRGLNREKRISRQHMKYGVKARMCAGSHCPFHSLLSRN